MKSMLTFLLIIIVDLCLVNKISSQIIRCEYMDGRFGLNVTNSYYRCFFNTTSSSDYNDQSATIVGYHLNGKVDSDVKQVENYAYTEVKNYLKTLSSIFCETFEILEAMHLINVELNFVYEDALQKCENLRYFDVRSNKIAELPEKLLFQNSKLRNVSLAENQLTTLPQIFFQNQRNLESLLLFSNQISVLPSNIFNSLRKLRKLQLENNILQVLDDEWFLNLQSLQYLSLNNNQLAEIPSKIFSPLVSIEKLYIHGNKIRIMSSDSFSGLKNLKFLSIHNNEISDLPPGIFSQLISLKELNLNENKIISIHSDSFGVHTQLTRFWTQDNKLYSIDEKFIINTAVSVLNMTNNICASFFAENKYEIKPKLSTCFKNYRPRVENIISKASCGKPSSSQSNIIGGTFITRGSFPWIAALIYDYNGKYFCGGTILSDRKIVTAAHCIQDKESKTNLLPRELKVLVGLHNLTERFEVGRRTVAVHNIHMHPAWNPKAEAYDADIAVVVTDESITFNRHIQPICSVKSSNVAAIVKTGIVVGYGKSEDGSKIHEETPKIIKMPIHSNEDCFFEFPDLVRISSRRTFCAGYANETGVCLGDSGSGLFVKNDGIYYLRGIVSSSIRGTKHDCDVHKYSVFTNILKFTDWIDRIDVEEPYFI